MNTDIVVVTSIVLRFTKTYIFILSSLFITVTDQSFLQFFQQYGDVIDSVVLVDRKTKRPRGFGFVTFADPVRRIAPESRARPTRVFFALLHPTVESRL